MNEHVDLDLSAYLDAELSPAERARVASHLGACAACSARLAELRATATLIAALPSARPARSLVPSLAPRWNWLRPLRSLTTVASGAFLFVFLVSAVAQSGSDLGGGPSSPFTRTGPAGAPAAVPAATGAAEEKASATAAGDTALRALTPSAAPAAAPAAAPTDTAFAAQGGGPTAAPDRGRTDAATAPAGDAELMSRSARDLSEPQPISPFVWLALAIVAGVTALIAHRRLRTA